LNIKSSRPWFTQSASRENIYKIKISKKIHDRFSGWAKVAERSTG